jgi:sex pheromone cAD1
MINKKLIILVISFIFLFYVLAINAQYKDGIFSGTYDHFDSHGWKPQLDITVSNGKIVKAAMNYVNKNGGLKSEDKNYAESMKKKTGVAPSEAYSKLQAAILKKQASGVDAVTGATDSSNYFNNLSKLILENAKTGNKAKVIITMNDTYSAGDNPDKDGYTGKIAIEIKDNKIVKATYDEVNSKNIGKSKDENLNKQMKSKTGKSWIESVDMLINSLISKQNADSIESVKGFDSTSKRFKDLAVKALSGR